MIDRLLNFKNYMNNNLYYYNLNKNYLDYKWLNTSIPNINLIIKLMIKKIANLKLIKNLKHFRIYFQKFNFKF